jgi:CubicO group peptidase (beta-lactamase class C family)
MRLVLQVRGFVTLIVLLTLSLSLATIQGAVAQSNPVPPNLGAIDAYIEKQMQEQRIPGLALAIVRGDQIVHLKGFGEANASKERVTPQTSFSIGSLTKSFTALAVMQLVNAGKLELDAPVQRYLPWFRVADADVSARITVRHLLNNASGLPRDFEGTPAVDLQTRLTKLSSLPLEQPLGTYNYSNVGYQLLAMLIQTVTGQSYEAYISQSIFSPLKMSRSFAPLPQTQPASTTVGYHYWFGLPVASGLPPYRTGPGNGGIFASAEDMAHYLIAQLNGGRYADQSVLSAAGIAELHKPAVARPDGHYAMGWGVKTNANDKVTTLSHSGQTYNYFAKMILVPESGWGVVVLQNSQYMLKLIAGDYSQDTIADGVVSLLLGQQPSNPSGNFVLLLIYGLLVLLIVGQVVAIVWFVIKRRRWEKRPDTQRLQGRKSLLWRVILPLVLNLGWAIVVLGGLLATGQITLLSYQMPDIFYTLLASGLVALIWGIIRTVWAYLALRKFSSL